MPDVPVQGQCPVNSAKSIRDGERRNPSEQVEILHKGCNRCLECPVFQKWKNQAQIHRETAQLKREKPPVVMLVIDCHIQKNLFVDLADRKEDPAEKQNVIGLPFGE